MIDTARIRTRAVRTSAAVLGAHLALQTIVLSAWLSLKVAIVAALAMSGAVCLVAAGAVALGRLWGRRGEPPAATTARWRKAR